MFELGKKYMFSKRKYLKTMEIDKSFKKGWIDDIAGIPFIVTEDMYDDIFLKDSVRIKYGETSYVVYNCWCIEVI